MSDLKRTALSSAFIIGLSLAATACTSNTASNRSLNSVHQPVVSRSNFALDLNVRGGSLPVSEQAKLAQWFEAMGLGYGDRVAIDDPAKNRSVRSLVEASAAKYGLLVADAAPITGGTIAPGDVRVVISRSSARVDGCPDWSSVSETNFNNATSSNFGCAANSNLASMVADPEDLVRGQGDGTSDADTGTKAIDTLRQTPPTGAGGLRRSNGFGGGAGGGQGGGGGGGAQGGGGQ
ncbi:CpaD family pilus assembly protein [Alterisphingorhabdus coralli]|uniref:CpaD family pilus assembly protein n=1 Tax=Alterisphingorhabdus coralli TaxID=3071408 RepID=A0AA97F7D7_9SPHN|nr:CpaD family pilus assembly protein [Parasphingorhabdus sp. SCSIO 66989]WOE74617.1 CpaD family pilus assembly protein [Parasphingorhabdus sp. SCSIO 66989]